MEATPGSYNEAKQQLELLWRYGPTETLRNCARPAPDWGGKPVWKRRCKSNACRPGNPYGCAAEQQHAFRIRSEHILEQWIANAHAAYLGTFGIVGQRDERLSHILKLSQVGIRSAVQDQRRRLRSQGVVGQIFARAVSRSVDGRWIVRRWVVLGTQHKLSNDMIASVSDSTARRWRNYLDSTSGHEAGHFRGLDEITSLMANATVRAICGDPWKTDSVTQILLDGLHLRYELGISENSPGALARDYYRRSERLGRPLTLDDARSTGSAFIEYAESLSTGAWNAYPAGGTTSAAAEWDRYRAKGLELSKDPEIRWNHVPWRARPKRKFVRITKK